MNTALHRSRELQRRINALEDEKRELRSTVFHERAKSLEERNAEIRKLRDAGVSFNVIGKRFGFGGSRARQLYLNNERPKCEACGLYAIFRMIAGSYVCHGGHSERMGVCSACGAEQRRTWKHKPLKRKPQ